MFWVFFWVLLFSDLVFLACIVVASEAFDRKLLKLEENEEVGDASSGSVRLFSSTFFFACYDVDGLIVDHPCQA